MRPALLWLLVAACSIGPRASRFAPATQAGGARATVAKGDSTFDAELLAVTDTGLFLVRDSRIVLVRMDAFEQVYFPDLPDDLTLRRGTPLSTQGSERLRLFSRYPSGLSPALLARLLAAYRQDSLVVQRP